MNELEKIVFDSHVNNLIKAKLRIKELESAMQLIVEEIEGHETRHIDICIKAKAKFKQLLSKRNHD